MNTIYEYFTQLVCVVHDFKVDKINSVTAFFISYLWYIEWRDSIKPIDFFPF